MTATSAIRLIHDAVLHRPGKLFSLPFNAVELDELHRQIAIAKNQLISNGGAGIAANQCADIADPYCFTIVGVFHDIQEHYKHARIRYPTLTFPEAVIMINPQIINSSEEQQVFAHGCLSVPGMARAEMKSPIWLDVRYYAMRDNTLLVENLHFEGSAAVVLDHELKHILQGQVYLDVCIAQLSQHDKKKMQALIDKHLALERNRKIDKNVKNKFIAFITVDDSGAHLNEHAFSQVINTMPLAVLHGLSQRLQINLQKY